MTTRAFDISVRGALAATAAMAAFGCGPSPITSARIERAVAPTFANLVHLQILRVGLTPVAASDIRVRARCHRLAADGSAAGAGEWECILDWYGPNRRSLRDVYDLSVGTDGCYTGIVEGGEGRLGGPTVPAQDGRSVRNLLYAFDGCFDTT